MRPDFCRTRSCYDPVFFNVIADPDSSVSRINLADPNPYNMDPDLVNGLYRKVARKIKEGRKHCMKTLFCLKFIQIFLVQENA